MSDFGRSQQQEPCSGSDAKRLNLSFEWNSHQVIYPRPDLGSESLVLTSEYPDQVSCQESRVELGERSSSRLRGDHAQALRTCKIQRPCEVRGPPDPQVLDRTGTRAKHARADRGGMAVLENESFHTRGLG